MSTVPVEPIVTDDPNEKPEKGIALCLSGGGYRAMLFHVGVLWRLYETGLLPSIKRISSVSGGSITAGVLGLSWSKLSFDPAKLQSDFVACIVSPIRALAGETIDGSAIILASPCQAGSAIRSRQLMIDICFMAPRCKTFLINRVSC